MVESNEHAEIARLQEQVKALYRLLDEREKQLNIAFTASQKAVDTALGAQQQVNSTQNEFRGTLRDQAGTLATKIELSLQVERLSERLSALERQDASTGGRARGISAAQAFVFAIITLGIAVASLLWNIAR